MSKTTRYSVLILVLLIANFLLLFADKVASSPTDRTYLKVDDLTELNEITVFYDKREVTMRKVENAWILNERYPVDESFFSTLLSVLERIEVVRAIGIWEEPTLGRVELSFGGTDYQFQFASNPTRTKSFFIKDGSAKEVIVPGYRDNVVDIFMLHPDQWRNRMVFDGSWRTIQRLEVRNGNIDPVQISFDDEFLLVNGQAPTDSSAVVDYLNQFQYFEANEMISKGRFPQFDSLALTTPMAYIEMEDIKYEEPVSFQIYPNLEGQGYHLVRQGDEMMVVDKARVQRLLATREDFLGSD